MNYNIIGFITLLLLSVGIAVVIYVLIHRSLTRLIDETVKIPSCTTFYIRIFQVGIILIFSSAALGQSWQFKQDAAFMEYVWNVAHGISSAFVSAALFIGLYLILITILISVLLRHDK